MEWGALLGLVTESQSGCGWKGSEQHLTHPPLSKQGLIEEWPKAVSKCLLNIFKDGRLHNLSE